jgi:hypothetical protein
MAKKQTAPKTVPKRKTNGSAKNNLKSDPKPQSPPNNKYRAELVPILDSMLLRIPFVKRGSAFGYPSYTANDKTFVFVGWGGIAIKLNNKRVESLLKEDSNMRPFYPAGGLLWKGWIELDLQNAEDYRNYAVLLEESALAILEKAGLLSGND